MSVFFWVVFYFPFVCIFSPLVRAPDLDRGRFAREQTGRYKTGIGHQRRCCCDDDYRHSRQGPRPKQTVSRNAPSVAGCLTPQSIDQPACAPSAARATCGEKILRHRIPGCAVDVGLSLEASTALPRSRCSSTGLHRLCCQQSSHHCHQNASALREHFSRRSQG